jgi:hypothetical protein
MAASEQQIADYRERGIVPPLSYLTACVEAFDGGPDRTARWRQIERHPHHQHEAVPVILHRMDKTEPSSIGRRRLRLQHWTASVTLRHHQCSFFLDGFGIV